MLIWRTHETFPALCHWNRFKRQALLVWRSRTNFDFIPWIKLSFLKSAIGLKLCSVALEVHEKTLQALAVFQLVVVQNMHVQCSQLSLSNDLCNGSTNSSNWNAVLSLTCGKLLLEILWVPIKCFVAVKCHCVKTSETQLYDVLDSSRYFCPG